ncbi:SDR family oxidoreductase [Actinopolymorpha sp. NPDC004070]|uniref:SDR family NAD(P)-dependent oxidoreductase n=1 Tax=Actinopolymorpha sp. NPDC004070 TaxID=3154548 RepID=UPI0033B5C489
MMIDTGLAGRVAVVTGSNSPLGIGAAIARALAREGVAIGLAFLPTPPPPVEPATVGGPEYAEDWEPGARAYAVATASDGSQVLAEVRAEGVEAEIFVVDLTDPAASAGLLGEVEHTLGPVDILVNNAALSVPDTFVPQRDPVFYFGDHPVLDAANLDRHYALNTRAPALLMADFHRRVLARGGGWGRIVNIGTDGAPQFPGEVSYGATKYALESLSRSAAQEMAAAGITVNTVAPGPVQTGWIGPDLAGTAAAMSPFGRLGQPEDIADIAVFLASEQARWLSGQTLYAGGGKRTF